MLYDVFISYSRVDSRAVNSLIDLLRREIPGIRIWFDIDGIETAEAFRTKIIKAIDESNAVLFVCSNNSLESEYCEKEVMYAKHKRKTVIPYLLPGMELDGWLLFEFGNINCINASKPDEVSRMVKDIKRWAEQNVNSTSGSSNRATANSLESDLYFDSASGEFKHKSSINRPTNGFINGYEYVDLGLPSGLKWATYNVGASLPEGYGLYFAWGEVRPKTLYTIENSETYGINYELLLRKNYIGKDGNLTLPHDAARCNWGGTWRMPTSKEIKELIDNTTIEWITRNGVKGSLVRSKKNGNSIFLPAAGFCSPTPMEIGEFGNYWSSTPHPSYSQEAYMLFTDSGLVDLMNDDRHLGRTIRPVSD